jgi:hypothetical protein
VASTLSTPIRLGITNSILLMIVSTIFGITLAWLQRRRYLMRPNVALVFELVRVYSGLQRGRDAWLDVHIRAHHAEHLEHAAVIATGALRKQLHSGDRDTSIWVRERTEQLAVILRDLKRALLWPMADTHEFLSMRLKLLITMLLRGNWTALTDFPVAAPVRFTLRKRLLSIVPATAFVLAPFGLLALAKFTSARFPPTIEPYVTLLAYGWATVGLLLLLDPQTDQHMSMVADMFKLFRGKNN